MTEKPMVGFLDGLDLASPARSYKLYTRQHAKSFYFASHVLPGEKRMAAYAVYAFCRYADNLVDSAGRRVDVPNVFRRLNELRGQLRAVYADSSSMDPRLGPFQEAVLAYQIPEEYFTDLLRGVEMDLVKTRYETFLELKEYCYCVASVVGLIMTKIFGASNQRAFDFAADLGTAMQLTNILRDIREDYHLGRIYLPSNEMERFGISEGDLEGGIISEGLRDLMRFQVARARTYYVNAAQGIPMLTDDGSRLCVRLMSRTYGHILDGIEQRNYDVFSGRVFVPLATKLGIAAGALLGLGSQTEALSGGADFKEPSGAAVLESPAPRH